ncbi:MAG: CARDB domain-containing protein [Xanthomonadales bacterium]|nr:CARDB domain-containing protein [Xanthomonadales bacterium]
MSTQPHFCRCRGAWNLPGILAVIMLLLSGSSWAGGVPDLVIDTIDVDPTTWFLDQTTYIVGEVRNAGTGSSNATTADFYLSTDSTIDTNDLDFGDDNIVALNPGQMWFADLEPTLTPEPGTYWVGVCVRPVSGETNTANNCSAGVQVTIQENENICAVLPLSCGASVATAFSANDCDDSPRGRSHFAKVHTFEGLSGSDVTINAQWQGDGFLYLENPAGEVVAQNDDAGSIFESQIDYNLDQDGTWLVWATTFDIFDPFAYEISLDCENVPVTDLAITDIDASPRAVTPGGDVTITATLENLGSIATESTTLRYFLSDNNTIDTNDDELGTDPVGTLDGGAGTVDNITVSAPNTEGIYWVGACIDEVPLELTTDNNCSSAVQLSVQSGENIAITAGVNDAWFNLSTNGQGFFFNMFPGLDSMFVGWFTFEEAGAITEGTSGAANIGGPDQRWLTAFGGTSATLADLTLFNTSGGVFNSSEPVAVEMEDGSFEVSFSSCSNGVVRFNNTTSGLSGEIPITRISDDNVPLCEELSGSNSSDVLTTFEISPSQVNLGAMFNASWTTDGATDCTPDHGTGGWANLDPNPAGGNVMLSSNAVGLHVFDLTCSAVGETVTRRARVLVTDPQAEPVFQISDGLNDAWFNPATSGQGFFINVFPGRGEMFLAWFTYDTERPESATEAIGEPGHRWFTAFGPYDQNMAALDLEVTTGGVFNAAPPNPQTVVDGSISVEFIDCENGIVDFNIESANLVGTIPIQRISGDNTALCEQLSVSGEE